MPTCCKAAAINNAIPQGIPAFHSWGVNQFLIKSLRFRSITKTTRIRKGTAKILRLNVFGRVLGVAIPTVLLNRDNFQ